MPKLPAPELASATANDMDFLLRLRMETMEPHLTRHGIKLTAAQHRERVEHEFDNFYLIVVAGRRIGALKYVATVDSLEVLQLQILPGEQGRAYGEAVLQSLIRKANAAKQALRLSVLKESPAMRLYLRLGFQVVNEDEYEYQMRRPLVSDP